MGTSYRQRWLLRRIERGLCRSDPHMAGMLAIFARLTMGEAITSAEQAQRGTKLRRGLACLADALVSVTAWLADYACRVSRCIAIAWTVARRRFNRAIRATRAAQPEARQPLRDGGPGLPAG
jgi:hypothetical protein